MKLYNDYNSHLREKFGCKVYKIGIDAGFTCPNRDGKTGLGGCIYCNEVGSRASYIKQGVSVAEQISQRMKLLKERFDAKKFIAYFQAFTNTYAPYEKLESIYNETLRFSDIVGLSIGTRPDTINEDKLKLISEYGQRFDLWLEYGLQSSHNKTLKTINRGHNYNDFANAIVLTKKFKIPVCVHVILGLPGETRADMLTTAKRLAQLNIEGIKIHPLHVLRGSDLEKLYLDDKVNLLEENEYVEIVCDFLEILPKKTVIQRITGQGSREAHIAPLWALDKAETIKRVGETLRKRSAGQGFRYEHHPL